MYSNNPTWGETVKKLTPDGQGVDNIIEVGGLGTLHQSLKAIKLDGVISVIGSVSASDSVSVPTILDCWLNNCTARGVAVGSRAMMEEMVAAIETNDIHPILDDESFSLAQAKEAFVHFVS
jgi:NADPH:quinone reductase-like Zn-dependent oxidoreductase